MTMYNGFGFGGFGFVLWLIVYFVIFGIPVMQILKRTGFHPAWVLVIFVPLVNLIFLWIFAFSSWPKGGRA
jgi:hypothetical protein